MLRSLSWNLMIVLATAVGSGCTGTPPREPIDVPVGASGSRSPVPGPAATPPFEQTPCISGSYPGDSRPGYPYAVQQLGRDGATAGTMRRGGELGCDPY